MARLAIILSLLIGGQVHAQIFEDDFSDGDFANNPTWSGADSNFVIFDLAESSMLRLNDDEGASSYLSTPSTGIEGFWEFFIRIDGNAPSGLNKVEIILASDTSDLSSAFNGYGVRLGETGDDFFSLIRFDDGDEASTILSDTSVFKAGGSYRLKVSRDAIGNWSLEVGEGYNGDLKNSGNTGFDDVYTSSAFLGIKATYTSSRSDDFYFDFKIDLPIVEIEPILVRDFFVVSDTELDFGFTRDVAFSNGVEIGDFVILEPETYPETVTMLASDSLRITFADPLPKGKNTIQLSGIESFNNDTTVVDTLINFYLFDEFESGDVLVNEFLKDPPPNSGIPEYVEIINNSEKVFNLKDWAIGDNSNLTTISDTNYVLPPNSFLVLTNNPENLKSIFGDLTAHDVSLPRLNNEDEDQIRMYTGEGSLVDSLEYSQDWGGVDVAIERRSLNFESTLRANWGDSPALLGGTPGRENEVELDTTPPDLAEFEILSERIIELIFNESIQDSSAIKILNFGLTNPLSTSPTLFRPTIVEFSSPDTIRLTFDQPFFEFNLLEIFNQTDVFGNKNNRVTINFEYTITSPALEGEVKITEFAYKAPEGFSEFVEIFNSTDKNFDLQGWTFNDNSGSRKTISSASFFLKSGEYAVLAPDNTIIDNFGDLKLLDVTGFPPLNDTFDDLVLRNEEGILMDSLSYSNSWGGEEVTLERRSTEFPSTLRANWGDSPALLGGTPGRENEVELDTTPPGLAEFEILSERRIELIFNESIQDSSAIKILNFGLTNPLSASPTLFRPTIVEFSSPDSIRLTFDQPFFEFNLLEIFNQTDVFGNKNNRVTINFEYVITSTAEEGDVKITEFAYDAPEGFSEFVEIFNSTDKNFDLQGWTFNDNSGSRKTISPTSFFLKSGEYAVLAPDNTIIDNFEDLKLLDVTGFPALNNSFDDLVLRNEEGILMDSLSYSNSWGGEEVTLERRSVNFSGIYRENWGDSPALQKGTPGSANEIISDTEPPVVIASQFLSNMEIQLIFDERLFGLENIIPANYYDPIGPNPNRVTVNEDSVILSYENPFLDGDSTSIQLRNLTDLFGNVQNQQVVKLTFVELVKAERQNVVINEILYRRKDALSPEFVELFNPTAFNYDLSDWSFSDAGSSVSIPSSTILSAGEYLVLTDMEDFAASLSNGLYLRNFPSLNDSGDKIVIKNAEGVTIDSLYYDSNWGGDKPGISVERKDPLAASSDISNWGSSGSESGFSAGITSSIFEEDLTPPEILFSSISDSTIFIAFSEVVRILDETEITIQNLDVQLAPITPSVSSTLLIGILNFQSKQKSIAQSAEVTITNLSDFKGNVSNSVSIQVAEQLQSGDIIINEILFNPLANSEDNLPDQSEYIELFNRSEKAISLEGLFIHDAPDEDNEVRAIMPVSTQFKWMAPSSFLLIYSESEAENFDQSKVARYFELENVSEVEIIKVDRTSLSLASSDDAIYLADSTGATIDSVFYDESWQNPNLFDTRGVALERIDPDGPSNDASNWSSSTHVSGGTPLLQNTIYQEAGATPENVGITFSPNPFSPDEDGFEDNLFINYALNAPDYLLRVRIFDRYGREVRELVNNYQAGFEGSLIWDGLTDDRSRNRVGIYIVYFEAYDSANGRNRTFKETVVLARKF